VHVGFGDGGVANGIVRRAVLVEDLSDPLRHLCQDMVLFCDVSGSEETAVAGYYHGADGRAGGLESGGPVERMGIAHLGRFSLLHQISHERDPSAVDDDVGVCVAAPVIGGLQLPPSDVDGRDGLESTVRGNDPDPLDLAEALWRHPFAGILPVLVGEVPKHGPAASVAPNGGSGEASVTEDVVPVPVGVEDPPNRLRREVS